MQKEGTKEDIRCDACEEVIKDPTNCRACFNEWTDSAIAAAIEEHRITPDDIRYWAGARISQGRLLPDWRVAFEELADDIDDGTFWRRVR